MTGGGAGMTGGGAGMTGGGAGMTGGTEAAPEKCRSSLGTPISALAYKRVMKKTHTLTNAGMMSRDIPHKT
jgi:hypothetical protein